MNSFSLLISVCQKDEPSYFLEAMESVLASTVCPEEIVLVIDGRLDDGLKQIIETLHGRFRNLHILYEEWNQGLGYALARGMDYCSSKLVARLDADDVVHPNRFEHQLRFFEQNPDVDILGTFATRIDAHGKPIEDMKVPIHHSDIVNNLWANPLIHPSVMFKKDRILGIGNYNPMLPRRQDYELWFRAFRAGLVFYNIPMELLYYRTVGDQFSRIDTRQAWNQSVIGASELRKSKSRFVLYFLVFYPFLRSLLPASTQKLLNRLMKRFDPRARVAK